MVSIADAPTPIGPAIVAVGFPPTTDQLLDAFIVFDALKVIPVGT